jgi:hypothetical protein
VQIRRATRDLGRIFSSLQYFEIHLGARLETAGSLSLMIAALGAHHGFKEISSKSPCLRVQLCENSAAWSKDPGHG